MTTATTRRLIRTSVAMAIIALSVTPSLAASAWDEIRNSVFQNQKIQDGRALITLSAPTRPKDMRVVPIAADVSLHDGRTIKAVTFILDENPTPVVAVFHLKQPRHSIFLKSNFRVDRQSDVRAIVETSDGKLYMVSRLIKFAGGQASCSAPPQGDPKEIQANMGKMQMTEVKDKDLSATSALGHARVKLSHPNHTGMVMDQITLLYTPMKMISNITIQQGGKEVMSIDGSIALSQNPVIEFDYRRGPHNFDVSMSDTDGDHWSKSFKLGPES